MKQIHISEDREDQKAKVFTSLKLMSKACEWKQERVEKKEIPK